MRCLMSFYCFFLFVFSPLALGEEIPPLDASLSRCVSTINNMHQASWERYSWERKNSDGIVSLFFLDKSAIDASLNTAYEVPIKASIYEYIADGEEHDVPHSGEEEMKYTLTLDPEEMIHMTIKGHQNGHQWEIIYKKIVESSKEGILRLGMLKKESQPGTQEKKLTFGEILCVPVLPEGKAEVGHQ